MCVFAGNAVTGAIKSYVGRKPGSRRRTLSAYQHDVRSLDAGPNCVFLPVPVRATQESIDRVQLIDTTAFATVLDDMAAASPEMQPKSFSMGRSLSRSVGPIVRRAEVGLYSCVMGDPRDVYQALNDVRDDRRPRHIEADLMAWIDELRPGWALLIGCFNSEEMLKSQPLMTIYDQDFCLDHLHMPGLESHNGLRQDPRTLFPFEQTLMVSADHLDPNLRDYMAGKVTYRGQIPEEIREYFPEYVMKYEGDGEEGCGGDFFVDVRNPAFTNGSLERCTERLLDVPV